MGWRPFVLGVVLTLVVGIAGIVVVSHLRDRDDSASCHGARARMTLSSSATGGFIATVTVYDERKRDWELQDDYFGTDNAAIPANDNVGPDSYSVIVTVSDADDGYTKSLGLRPVGEQEWCELKARIGLGF